MDKQSAGVVFAGHPLKHRHRGLGVLAARMFRLHQKLEEEVPGTVLLPENLQGESENVPAEMLSVLEGTPWSNRLVLQDVYWQHRMAEAVRRTYADSIFMALFHFAALSRPRNTIAFVPDVIYRVFPETERSLPRRLHYRLTEWYARRCRLVLTLSEHAKSELVRLKIVPEQKICVFYPWIEDSFISLADQVLPSELRARYALPDNYWMYVGGFDIHKNLEFMLKAYACASSTARIPALVLAGAVPPEGAAGRCRVHETIRELGLSPQQVHLPGAIHAYHLPALYKHANLLVYPSRYEGFGYPPAEARAVGTPVLCADATSLVEVIPERHCRFSIASIDELKEKLVSASLEPNQYRLKLPDTFTESAAIERYRGLLSAMRNNHVV